MKVVIQPAGGVVGVDVEPVPGEPRNVGPHEAAAERHNQAVIANGGAGAAMPYRRALGIDALHLSDLEFDTGRRQQRLERQPGRGEIGLVVAYADVVERHARHRDDLDVLRQAELIPPSSRRNRRPESGKTRSQNEHPLHHEITLCSIRCSRATPQQCAYKRPSRKHNCRLLTSALALCTHHSRELR